RRRHTRCYRDWSSDVLFRSGREISAMFKLFLAGLVFATLPSAQPSDVPAHFEVASIKPVARFTPADLLAGRRARPGITISAEREIGRASCRERAEVTAEGEG